MLVLQHRVDDPDDLILDLHSLVLLVLDAFMKQNSLHHPSSTLTDRVRDAGIILADVLLLLDFLEHLKERIL